MYKVLGWLNIAFGLTAVYLSLSTLLFPHSFLVHAVKYDLLAQQYTYLDLKLLLTLTLGISGIFFGYKTVDFKFEGDPPVIIHRSFMAFSIFLDLVVFLSVTTGL